MLELSENQASRQRMSREEVADACKRILGRQPEDIDDLTELRRKSAGAMVNGERVFVSCRDSEARAQLEAHVLRTLHDGGAPVPRLLGIDGRWLIQESLGNVSLSSALRRLPATDFLRWQDAALTSLAGIHEIAQTAGLEQTVYRIGERADWLDGFMQTPQRLSDFLALAPPQLDLPALRKRLAPGKPTFIKWDARPPNAMPRRDGSVAWFDWEHCGCRNRLDDLAWFLGDESIPEIPDTEERLISHHLAHFSHETGTAQAERYLYTFGSLHIAVRLSITVTDHAHDCDPLWRETLSNGRIGALPASALRLCQRGARWASRAPETAALSAWFQQIERRFGDTGAQQV